MGDVLLEVQGRAASDFSLRALRQLPCSAWLRLEPGSREDREEVATVRLQAAWRGYRLRHGFSSPTQRGVRSEEILESHESALVSGS